MTLGEFVRHYLRSPLGIGSLLAGPLAGLVVGGLGLGPGLVAFAVLAAPLAAFGLGLVSGIGPRAAAREAEAAMARQNRVELEAASLTRRRLSALRIVEPEVAAARDLLVLEAGRYLEAALATQSRDPEADAALEEAQALIDAWLHEADESATERRFGQADTHPFPDAAARVAAELRERATLVARARERVSGLPTFVDRVAAEEELS